MAPLRRRGRVKLALVLCQRHRPAQLIERDPVRVRGDPLLQRLRSRGGAAGCLLIAGPHSPGLRAESLPARTRSLSDHLPRPWLFPLTVFAATWVLIVATWNIAGGQVVLAPFALLDTQTQAALDTEAADVTRFLGG